MLPYLRILSLKIKFKLTLLFYQFQITKIKIHFHHHYMMKKQKLDNLAILGKPMSQKKFSSMLKKAKTENFHL